jgi:glycosyltransferase involved in cell wall biosynthesis
VLVQTDIGRAKLLEALRSASVRRAAELDRKLLVVGNGLDMPTVVPRDPAGPVLTLGRLVRDKGMDVVIEACAAIGRRLIIAGSGPERCLLERRAAALHADVQFTGFVEGDELRALYRQASAVVLASHNEGLPNVVLEGMAHGRPVLSTPVGGVTSVIQDGVNGCLMRIGDSMALASALRKLDANPTWADQVAAAGRMTVQRFEWNQMGPQLVQVLSAVVHGSGAPGTA